jgi:plastocyanin
MKTSYIVIAVVIALVVIGGVLMLQSGNTSQSPSLGQEENMTPPLGVQPRPFLMVLYSDEGYSPKELKIKKGETVTFQNESSQPMWTASAIHPNHTVYPGTDIKNCGSAPMGMMFDSCVGTSMGSSWMFQFSEAGSWGYHNHLRPTHTGKIIVE